MRTYLYTLWILLFFPAALDAGFSFGLVSAAKKTADKVESKVAAKKHEIDAMNTSLSWTGEDNYFSDGLNQNGGDVSASFVYRVKYTNTENIAPAPGYPKVHIKKNGVELSGSPFPMSFVSGEYNAGAIYTYSTPINTPGDDYTYFFEARNLNGTSAAGAPTFAVDGPDIAVGRIFSTPKNDYAYSVKQTSDSGYIISGATEPGNNGGGLWLIKTDSSSNLLWDKTFGNNREVGYSVQQTSDGGYVIGGLAWGWNIGLIKTDSSGNQSWSKSFGTPDMQEGYSAQQTADGGYIIAGAQINSFGNAWLIKTDSGGNQTWLKTFDGGGTDSAQSVQQTSDGGYIMAGRAGWNLWLIKADSGGNQVWTKTFGGIFTAMGYSVKETADGGYIVVGSSASTGGSEPLSDILLIKTDSGGNKVWGKLFGGGGDDVGRSVSTTTDGGYLIAGYTSSYGSGGRDVWLIKTDSAGNQVWAKTFGGPGEERGYSAQQTADGGYVVVGNATSYGRGDLDVWLIKTDSNGNPQ